MNRVSRRFVAAAAVIALLFATLSVAAYACPETSATMGTESAMPEGCPDRDQSQLNLCKAHCTAEQQQAGTTAPDVPPLVLQHGLLASLLPTMPGHSPAFLPPSKATPEHATDPPIAIRNYCFRL
ncbi:MAG: hypothetical protein K2Y35_14525 [Burkholderiales bacterium]|jgi:hypothetical protein|nr:hypothetical protein [Burkholderiales bacterium]